MAGLSEIIAEEIGIAAAEVRADQTLTHDLDIDSLSRLTIVTQAEDQFKVSVPDDVLLAFTTVGDIAAYIATPSSS